MLARYMFNRVIDMSETQSKTKYSGDRLSRWPWSQQWDQWFVVCFDLKFFPSRYKEILSQAHVIARVSFSICTYLCLVAERSGWECTSSLRWTFLRWGISRGLGLSSGVVEDKSGWFWQLLLCLAFEGLVLAFATEPCTLCAQEFAYGLGEVFQVWEELPHLIYHMIPINRWSLDTSNGDLHLLDGWCFLRVSSDFTFISDMSQKLKVSFVQTYSFLGLGLLQLTWCVWRLLWAWRWLSLVSTIHQDIIHKLWQTTPLSPLRITDICFWKCLDSLEIPNGSLLMQ